MQKQAFIAVLSLFALTAPIIYAQPSLQFADVFTDNMVLQRDADLTCWGTAEAGAEVRVLLTQSRDDLVAFAGRPALERPEARKPRTHESPKIGNVRITYLEESPLAFTHVARTVTADANGKWEASLGTLDASFVPTFLAAKSGSAAIAVKNLLVGEVWIASGQSNMEWSRTRDKMWENQGLIFNGLRYAKVDGDSGTPRETLVQSKKTFGWMVCEDGAVSGVSTVPYLFGQYLHRRLKVPVGIINIAMGGSYAREWCSRDVLEAIDSPTLAKKLETHDAKIKADPTKKDSRGPSSLFNARLYPIRHLAVAGVVYLQGENEALTGDLPQYVKTFPGVIESYRRALGRPDLPFGIITLQGMGSSEGYSYGSYSVAREIHLKTHERTPNTGYIVAHDIGGGIHPNFKRPLAERAVYWALRDVYRVIPSATKMRFKAVEFSENQAIARLEALELKNGEWVPSSISRLDGNNQSNLGGFMIAGEDRQWYPGRVGGTPGDRTALTITHPMVMQPVALRYGWEGWSKANLGPWHDPIPPYRSDDWPVLSADRVESAPGELTTGQLKYKRMNDARNLKLELPLQAGTAQAGVNLMKRHKHPKPMMLAMLDSMETLLDNFNAEQYNEMAPELRELAMHKIPPRYWRRDRYTTSRRAKWGDFIECMVRFEALPDEMTAALSQPGVNTKLEALREALADLKGELEALPDPAPMSFDEMLDIVLPVMEQEKERLLESGVDLRRFEKDMNSIPF